MSICYVDQQHANANDTNQGTENAPLKTIAAAIARVNEGTVTHVRVNPGIYREFVHITKGGTKEAPVIIEATKPRKVVITGADVMEGFTHVKDGVWKKEGVTLSLPTSEKHGARVGNAEQVFVDGHMMKQALYPHEIAAGTFYYDEKKHELLIAPNLFPGELRGGDALVDMGEVAGGQHATFNRDDLAQSWQFLPAPFDLNAHTVEVTTRVEVLRVCKTAEYKHAKDTSDFVSNVIIRGFHMRYGASLPQTPIVYIKGEENVLENAIVEYGNARGVDLRGTNITMRNTVIRNNGQMGFSAYGKGHLVENVDLLYNNYKHSSYACFEQGGCKVVYTTDMTMRGCRAIGNDGPGIWFDIDNERCVIEECWCEGNSGPGIMYEISFTATIRNNICVRNGFLYNKDVRFNTRHHSMGHAEGIYGQGILIQFSEACEVYNNTCVGNKKTGIELRHHAYQQGAGAQYDTERYRVKDNKVFNNIMVDNGGDNLMIARVPGIPPKDDEVSGNEYDYNLYHMTEVFEQYGWNLPRYARFGKNFLSSSASLEEWRVLSEEERHSIQWDPYFLAPDEKNFKLDRHSPAIGRGKRIEGLERDFFGRPRPKDAPPTIGAVEFTEDDLLV